jgi:hypothetical protein
MKRILLLALLVTACKGRDAEGSNEVGASGSQGGPPAAGRSPVEPDKAGDDKLAGLYEGGQGPRRSQICMVDKGSGTQFGLLVWGDALRSCSGAGQAVRHGERLSLKMAGDETCTIDARISGGTITLPASVPPACSYYCGEGARMAGASFARTGSSEADALKAKDIAGDALCG